MRLYRLRAGWYYSFTQSGRSAHFFWSSGPYRWPWTALRDYMDTRWSLGYWRRKIVKLSWAAVPLLLVYVFGFFLGLGTGWWVWGR